MSSDYSFTSEVRTNLGGSYLHSGFSSSDNVELDKLT